MKKILPLMIIFVLCLTGCSSTDPTADVTVTWEGGVVSNGKDAIPVASFNGMHATIAAPPMGSEYQLFIQHAQDVTSVEVNSQAILEEDMDKYKDAYYYTEYLGSRFTMIKPLANETYGICQCLTDGQPPAALATYAYDYLTKIPLTEAQLYVDFGPFVFGTEFDVVEVRPDCALISGVAKVSQDSHDTNESVTVIQNEKEYQLQKGSSSKYDYYSYEGYTIQVLSGMPVENYITFK